jgi:hypothetical protein
MIIERPESTTSKPINLMTIGMIEKLSELRQRVVNALGADHYLLRSIDLALAANDPVQGRVALDAINEEPEATWRQLMNGWSRPIWRPEAKELASHRRPLMSCW